MSWYTSSQKIPQEGALIFMASKLFYGEDLGFGFSNFFGHFSEHIHRGVSVFILPSGGGEGGGKTVCSGARGFPGGVAFIDINRLHIQGRHPINHFTPGTSGGFREGFFDSSRGAHIVNIP